MRSVGNGFGDLAGRVDGCIDFARSPVFLLTAADLRRFWLRAIFGQVSSRGDLLAHVAVGVVDGDMNIAHHGDVAGRDLDFLRMGARRDQSGGADRERKRHRRHESNGERAAKAKAAFGKPGVTDGGLPFHPVKCRDDRHSAQTPENPGFGEDDIWPVDAAIAHRRQDTHKVVHCRHVEEISDGREHLVERL